MMPITSALIHMLNDSAQAVTSCTREQANLYHWRARGALHLWRIAATTQEQADHHQRVQEAMLRVDPQYID
jgi:hypothetical protein